MVLSIVLSFSLKGQEDANAGAVLVHSKKVPCWSSGGGGGSNRYVECASCILVSGIPGDDGPSSTCDFIGQEEGIARQKDRVKQQKASAKQRAIAKKKYRAKQQKYRAKQQKDRAKQRANAKQKDRVSSSSLIICWSSGKTNIFYRYVKCGSCTSVSGLPEYDSEDTCNTVKK